MAKVVPAAVDLHNNDNNVAAVVAMAHVAHAATALQSTNKDKDKATVADLQKVRVMLRFLRGFTKRWALGCEKFLPGTSYSDTLFRISEISSVTVQLSCFALEFLLLLLYSRPLLVLVPQRGPHQKINKKFTKSMKS